MEDISLVAKDMFNTQDKTKSKKTHVSLLKDNYTPEIPEV